MKRRAWSGTRQHIMILSIIVQHSFSEATIIGMLQRSIYSVLTLDTGWTNGMFFRKEGDKR